MSVLALLHDTNCLLGLYHKLHGVHRPVTMKKSVIKRRKRVVPVGQGNLPITVDNPNYNTLGSPDSEGHSPPPDTEHRGSMNPDGSINLGFKRQQQDQQRPHRQLLPEFSNRSSHNGNGNHHNGHVAVDLNAYNTSQHKPYHEQSLRTTTSTSENKLPPMATYPSPTQNRPPSLSPNPLAASTAPPPLVSPSRKRSFSSSDQEYTIQSENQQLQHSSKRLSSIKSILNPSNPNLQQQHIVNGTVSISISMSDDQANASIDPSLRPNPQPPQIQQKHTHLNSNGNGKGVNGNGMRYTNGNSSNAMEHTTPSSHYGHRTSPRMMGAGSLEEEERRREDRREELRREMDRMREVLRGKEREFEELGGVGD